MYYTPIFHRCTYYRFTYSKILRLHLLRFSRFYTHYPSIHPINSKYQHAHISTHPEISPQIHSQVPQKITKMRLSRQIRRFHFFTPLWNFKKSCLLFNSLSIAQRSPFFNFFHHSQLILPFTHFRNSNFSTHFLPYQHTPQTVSFHRTYSLSQVSHKPSHAFTQNTKYVQISSLIKLAEIDFLRDYETHNHPFLQFLLLKHS